MPLTSSRPFRHLDKTDKAKRKEILLLFLTSLLLLSSCYALVLQVQASPEEVEKVTTEIKLSQMEGWPGESKVGVAGNFEYEGEYGEKEINLKFTLPPYISNIISVKLRLYLFAKVYPSGWAPGAYATVGRIEVNGYVTCSNYVFCHLGSCALCDKEKSTWVEWEIPLQHLRPGANSLTIEIELSISSSGARSYYEFYIYDYSSLQIKRYIKKFTISFSSEPKMQGIIIDGELFTQDRLPCSFVWEEGSVHTFSIPSTVIYEEGNNRTRYLFAGWSDGNTSASRRIMALSSASYTAMFKAQHHVSVSSEYGSVSGSGWYDEGSTAMISVTPEVTDFGNGTRKVFKSWTGDFSGSSATAKVTVDSPKNIRASWGCQYHLSISSEYGSPTGAGWYYPGQLATVSAPSIVDLGGGVRKVFAGWVGDYSSGNSTLNIAVSRPMSLAAKWKTQYFLKAETRYGRCEGEGWYDEGSKAYVSLKETEVEESVIFIRYFARWAGDASGTGGVSDPIYMDSPKTAIAVWEWKLNPRAVGLGIMATFIAIAAYVALTRTPVKQVKMLLIQKIRSPLRRPALKKEEPRETEKLPPPPSASVGKYRILEAIGEGAFAVVFKAMDDRGRLVALKVPKKGKEAEEVFVNEVNRLNELAGKGISHRNIVEVYGFGLRPEPYIAMELCDSNVRGVKLSEDEVLKVMLEVADALIYAHNKGVVHGDIKPSNILIKDGVPKIGDWGFACTPEYAAPEIFEGREPDERSDIWSFGVTFYEVLKGVNPFSGSDPFEILGKMKRGIDTSGLGRFENVIRRCLSIDDRYRSFEEVKRDLMSLRKASSTFGRDVAVYTFSSLRTSISTENADEVNAKFSVLKEHKLLPDPVANVARKVWDIKVKAREGMTYDFLEASYREMLSCLSGYEEAFEKDEDVGGIIRRILAKRRDEVVPEKDRETVRKVFCERALDKLLEILNRMYGL
jgi:hypothetical protein